MDKIDAKVQLSLLIEKYQNLIFSICLKMTNDYFIAEDLTQETFLSAFKHLSKFDGKNEKSWLCKIATNKCLDYVGKAMHREVSTQDTMIVEESSGEDSVFCEYIDKDLWNRLEANCRQLKPPYDEIAIRYFVREQGADDIAAETGIKVKTIQTQVYRARAMLRKMYGKEEWIT